MSDTTCPSCGMDEARRRRVIRAFEFWRTYSATAKPPVSPDAAELIAALDAYLYGAGEPEKNGGAR